MLLMSLLGLAACNLPGSSANTTPTLNVTQAYQTVEARLTQVALASPPTATVLPPTATPNVDTDSDQLGGYHHSHSQPKSQLDLIRQSLRPG